MNDLDGMDTLISCQEKPIRHFDGSASDFLAKDGVWGAGYRCILPGSGTESR